MKKRKVLEHLIDIMYEGLFMDQINLELVKKRGKELNDIDSFEFKSNESKILQSIDARLKQIEIAEEMLNKSK